MYSKQQQKQISFVFQNFKRKDLCSKCIGRAKPRLLNYFKSICRNSKCYFHKNSTPNTTMNETSRTKNTAQTKIKLEKKKKMLRINEAETSSLRSDSEGQKKNIDEEIDIQLLKKIESTVIELENLNGMKFESVVGHRLLKEIINRTIIWPLKKPEIFKGLRSAPKAVLLFGPPGTGKTLIGQCIALETNSTFFDISPSTLISKWMGESEKLVRTMFTVAKVRQPSVIFIDEVHSILAKTTSEESESSRRMKNEFLVLMDGVRTEPKDKIVVVGVTHRPQELDEAARRRFVKRFYVPLPDETDRKELLLKLLKCECHSLQEIDISHIAEKTEGYSGADLKSLSQEAAMGPIKSISSNSFIFVKPDQNYGEIKF